jgi:hypothetical protein
MVNFSYEEITISTLPTCFDPKKWFKTLNTHKKNRLKTLTWKREVGFTRKFKLD